jgi:hypothetical protein
MSRVTAAIVAGLLAATTALGLAACTDANATGDPSATSDVQTPRAIVRPSTKPTVSAAPSATTPAGTVDPVIQHVYDICAPHAVSNNGATLVAPVPGDPAGLSVSDGLVSATFAIASFSDGHAVGATKYICSVTNKTTTSTLVSGGTIDTQ